MKTLIDEIIQEFLTEYTGFGSDSKPNSDTDSDTGPSSQSTVTTTTQAPAPREKPPTAKADDGTPIWWKGFGNYSSKGSDGEIDYTEKGDGSITPIGIGDEPETPERTPEPEPTQQTPQQPDPTQQTPQQQEPNIAKAADQLSKDEETSKKRAAQEVKIWSHSTPQDIELFKQETAETLKNAAETRKKFIKDWNRSGKKPRLTVANFFNVVDGNSTLKFTRGDGSTDSISVRELQYIIETKSAKGRVSSLASEALTVGLLSNAVNIVKQNENLTNEEVFNLLSKQIYENYPEDAILSKDVGWLNASVGQLVSSINALESIGYNISDIDGVYWDTGEGQSLAGTTGHNTSSDLFFVMKDGTVIGDSLKKDGAIIYANLGTIGLLEQILSDLPPDDPSHQILQHAQHKEFLNVQKQLSTDEMINSIDRVGAEICSDSDRAHEVFQSNAKTYCSARDSAIEQLRNNIPLKGNERKFVSRTVSNSGNPEFENVKNLYRQIDTNLVNKMLEAAEQSKPFKRKLTNTVISGLHVLDHLGLVKNPPPDTVITSYGTGAHTTTNEIYEMFLLEGEERKKIENIVERTKSSSGSSREEGMKKLKNFFADRISLQATDEGFVANLNVEDSGVTLAKLAVRTKGLGHTSNTLIVPTEDFRKQYLGDPSKVSKNVNNHMKNLSKYMTPSVNQEESIGEPPVEEKARNLIRSLVVRELERLHGDNGA